MNAYNPYTDLTLNEELPKRRLFEGGELEKGYNPYKDLELTPVPKDPLAWRPREEMTEAEKWEQDMAVKHPELFALVRTSLEFIPFAASFVSPEERRNFGELSGGEKANVLAWDTLFAAMALAAVFPKTAMKGVKYGVQRLKRLPFKPVADKKIVEELQELRAEDAFRRLALHTPEVDFRGFDFTKYTSGILKKEGFKKAEIDLLVPALQRGDRGFSRIDEFSIAELYRKKYKFSKAFEENVPVLPGKIFTRQMKPDFVALHSRGIMEAKYRKTTFEKVLKSLYKSKALKEFPEDFSLKVFQRQAQILSPVLGKRFHFGEASSSEMAKISLSLLEDPIKAASLIMPGTFPSLRPTRTVYGIGEKLFGTMSRVYKPIKEGLATRNRNYFNHMLLWAQLLKQEGLYKSIKIDPTGTFKEVKADFFTGDVAERAHTVLIKMDNLSEQARAVKNPEEKAALLKQAQEVAGKTLKKNDPAILLLNAWRTYSDHLYSDFIKKQFSRTLEKVKKQGDLPDDIIETLTNQSRLLEYEMDNLFSTVARKSYGFKMGQTKRLLGRAQRTILRGAANLSEDVLKRRKEIASLFAYDKRGGFPAYLQNYTARLREGQLDLIQSWRKDLGLHRQAAFRYPRVATEAEDTRDLATMIEARTMGQASELYLYDTLDKVVQYTKRLPPAWREYIDAHIGGLLGVPSNLDHKVAWFLTNTVGFMERALKKKGVFDEQRVVRLGHTINTLVYLGALGFKPFAAIRNLFQVLLNLPGDLGRLTDIGTLASGMKMSLDPKVRQKIIRWGGITEFAPEIHLRPAALPFGARIGKVDLPSLQRIQDCGLWMFMGADRFCRYVSGSAAMIKWSKALEKVGGEVHLKNFDEFSKHLGLAGRREAVRDDITRQLLKGNLEEGEKLFCLDVIADTQYLYGLADAPIIIRKHGALARTGFIFQSWWMNYGALLEKWIRTGEPPPQKIERMFTAMISHGIAFHMMEIMWGSATAYRTVALGPFPKEANEFLIPPGWKPVYHTMCAILNIPHTDISARHVRKAVGSAGIYLPGYLQMKQTVRGLQEEDPFMGFIRSIPRWKAPEEEPKGYKPWV